ncbi:glutamate-gated chloride channel alpha isoform X2 [Folsomia candida]|uniref:glutamate-gated chloride channel alpha isoform X2 n=1 Tax=Folsomia candida TaxID=158441 RepID=UPI000B8F1053|nr:glutamate-gated chloride channel alpha isoform X2 [Folsomia candida]
MPNLVKWWFVNYSWIVFLLVLCFLPRLTLSQYDAVDYELENEYDDDQDVHDDQQQQPPPPEATLIPPPPSQALADDKPTIFKLPEHYSVHKSPPLIGGEPIPVDFSMLVFNVFDIKEILEEISLEVNYKLYWKDTRLSNWTKNIDPGQKSATMSTALLHKVWHPDIFIDHIKRVTQPQLISPASSLKIYSDGSLRYTSRILLVLTCRMSFYYYPADTQECNVTMKSFAFSTKQIDLRWRDGIGALLAKSIEVHNFDVALETYPDYLQTTKSNNFSALVFGIKLRRKLSYHIIQTYIPSTMFTVVSWLSFLVPPDSTPGRMAICVTTLLTVTAMFGATKQNTPNVAYCKALDVWMLMCISFIFLSLGEFTIVLKLRKNETKKPDPPKKDEIDVEKNNHVTTGNNASPPGGTNSALIQIDPKSATLSPTPEPVKAVIPPKPTPPPPTKYFLTASKIEKYAPRVVPLLFIAFTCTYWPVLLMMSDYYSLSTDPEMFYSV